MKYFLLIFISLLVLIVDSSVYNSFHTPKNYLLIISVPVLILLISIQLLKNKIKTIQLSLIEILLIVRLFWIVFAANDLNQLIHSLGFHILLSLTALTIFVRIYNLATTTRKNTKEQLWFIEKTVILLFIIGAIQSFIGFYQNFQFNAGTGQFVKTSMIGTLGSANGFGIFQAISLLSGMICLVNFRSRLSRLFCVVGIIIVLISLIMNGSRGAILSFLFAVSVIHIIYLFSKDRKNKYAFATVISLVFVGVFIFLFGLNTESSFGRIMVWEISFPMLTNNLSSGIGFGEYAKQFLFYQSDFFNNPANLHLAYKAANLKQAHNEFFQAFFESGLIGGIIFLSIWGVAVFSLVKLIWDKSKQSKEMQFSDWLKNDIIFKNSVVMGILSIICFHSLMDTPLHLLPIAAIAYICLGLTTIPSFEIKLTGLLIGILISINTIFSIYSINKSITEYPSYQKWQVGNEFAQSKKWTWAISSYESALVYLPNNGELSFHLGSAYVFNEQYSKGLFYLNKSLSSFTDRNIFLSLSFAQLKLKNLSEAEKNAKIALAMFPDQLAPHLLLGEIYFYQGDTSLSKASLQKCINLETSIKSYETDQIKKDAVELWKNFYKN